MKKTIKAAIIAGASALTVGAIHYGAHRVFSSLPIEKQVIEVKNPQTPIFK